MHEREGERESMREKRMKKQKKTTSHNCQEIIKK